MLAAAPGLRGLLEKQVPGPHPGCRRLSSSPLAIQTAGDCGKRQREAVCGARGGQGVFMHMEWRLDATRPKALFLLERSRVGKGDALFRSALG